MRGAPHSQSPTSALSQYSLCFTSSALGGSAFGAGGVPAPLNHLGGGGGCSGLRTLGPSLEGPLPSPPAISHDFFFSFLAPLSLPFPLALPYKLILIWITPDTTRYLATLLGVSYLDTHTLPCSRIRRAIRARLRNRKQHFLRLHIRRHLRLHRHPLAIVHDLLSRRVVASVAQRRLHLRRRLLPPDPGTPRSCRHHLGPRHASPPTARTSSRPGCSPHS